MDGSQFDALTRRLTSIRLTRGSALRGMAAGALTLAGMTRIAEEASAGKTRGKYCQCDNGTETCTNEKAGKKARKRHLKQNPCSYKGKCRGTGTHNPCDGAGAPTTGGSDPAPGTTCTVGGNDCGDSAVTGLECVGAPGQAGVCASLDLNAVCNADTDCSTGRCTLGVCVECPETSICAPGNDAVCCAVDATCVSGICVLRLDSL